MSNNNVVSISAPIEFQVLRDGQVRFYCSNRGRLFNFQRKFNLQGELSYRGKCLITSLAPSQILEVAPYVSDSNWKKAVTLTDAALESTTDRNYRPVNSKVFASRVSKIAAQVHSLQEELALV